MSIKTPDWAFNPYTYFGGQSWWDNYAASPDDSDLWMLMFERATPDARAVLMICRNTGAQLIRNRDYGYIIQPIIGSTGWQSQAEYDEHRKLMVKYTDEIIQLLGELSK